MYELSTITEQHAGNVDLVFEGGGLRGIGLVGAYSVLEEHGFRPQNVAGASAGAIVAALVAAGYTASELREVLDALDFLSFKDRAWEDRLPALSRTVSILKDKGVYEGEAFQAWMTGLLEAKGLRTFGDLLRRPEAVSLYRHGLQVVASDLTDHRLLVLPRDAHKLGIEDPDGLEVALAVRMSMSIPLFFEPVSFTNPKTGREHVIVDGGMLSNFPVWLFDAEAPRCPTIGVKFVEEDPKTPLSALGSGGGIFSLVTYVRNLVKTMLEAHDRFYVEESDYHRTIAVDTLGAGITEFDLPRGRAAALYNSGRAAVERFLAQGRSMPVAQEDARAPAR